MCADVVMIFALRPARYDCLKVERTPDEVLRKKLKVVFIGEEGVDEGGVAKEFFQLLIVQARSLNFIGGGRGGKFSPWTRERVPVSKLAKMPLAHHDQTLTLFWSALPSGESPFCKS